MATVASVANRVAVRVDALNRSLPGRARRLARLVVLALVIGLGVNHIWWSIADWHLLDMNAYWNAGLRVRDGEALYPPVTNVLASDVYRYSPWFAWLWAPLTLAPREAVNVAWSAVLVGASGVAVWPMVKQRAWTAVAFFLPILIGISAGGNVQALLIASLVLGVDRRSGPVWIGLAASLKAFPILLALTYVGRRQWTRAAVTIAITALLLLPYLLYDLGNYVTRSGGAEMLSQWLPIYASVVIAAGAVTITLARSPYAWLASATTVAVALPRFFVYDVTYLAVGLARRDASGSAPSRRRGPLRPVSCQASSLSADRPANHVSPRRAHSAPE